LAGKNIVFWPKKLDIKMRRYDMCAICGCGIDAGNADSMFSKDYECLNCGQIFKAFGVVRVCPSCSSRRSKRVNVCV
jgi:hypothetical protein